LEDERHFRPKSRQMICTMLCCIRPVFVDIWRVIQSVCFWLSWFSKTTSSSTVVTFSSVRACFNLPLSCLCSVLPVIQIVLVMCHHHHFCHPSPHHSFIPISKLFFFSNPILHRHLAPPRTESTDIRTCSRFFLFFSFRFFSEF